MKNMILVLMALILPIRVWGASTGVHTWAESSALAEGKWVKVALNDTEDGIYQISYSQLRNWGFSNPSQVGVYGFGGHTLSESFGQNHIDDLPEVAVYHDSSRQRILFYGRGLISWSYKNDTYRWTQRQHPYATSACYFLHQKSGESPLQIEAKASSHIEPEVTLDEYDECWLHEVEETNLGQSGRMWYGESFLNSTVQTFNLTQGTRLAGHKFKAGTVLLTTNFVAKSQSTSSYSVQIDTFSIGPKMIPATTNSYGFGSEANINIPLSTRGEFGTSSVCITYKAGSSTSTAARLDYIRLQGKCPLEASAAEAFMLFRNIEAQRQHVAYTIAGLDNKMQIWDVTSPNAIFRQELADNSTQFVPEEKGLREYAVVNMASNDFSGVTLVGNVIKQNLHNLEPVNMVILSAPAFVAQAERLAEYRRLHDGLSVAVLTPEQIYNEYSSGVPDATAIRLFLKNLYEKGQESDPAQKLRYFLLFGDGHYNNQTATSTNYLLPCYEGEPSLTETSSFVCDDYFGFLDDHEGGRTDASGNYTITSDVLDIGIGRLPVQTLSQATDVVNKIIGYDSQYGSWKNRICFLSDDDKIENSGSDSPNIHMKHNDQLVSILETAGHNDLIFQKIYLAAYAQTVTSTGSDYPDARKEFYNALQQGSLIVNFAGHGSTTSITHEMIMTSNLASQLRMKHLPLWITASCDVSRWDANEESMGETLLLNPNGGASALISTTRVVYAAPNLNLNKAVIKHLFDRNPDGSRYRIGDILRTAKIELGSDYNKLNFCLLGDPAMTLAYAEQKMVIDSIKGEFTSLNEVTVYGHIQKLTETETDSTFNGLIYPTIYDAEEEITADKGLWQSTSSQEDIPYTFGTRTRKIFSGRDYVRQGKFSFRCTIPMDLSDLPGNGLINLYACSDDQREANGYYNDFQFKSTNSSVQTDTLGPVMLACFLDGPEFKSGDIVGKTPLFYAEVEDENGFNATGAGIGHDVSLTIQCLSNPLISIKQINLNNYFTTFTGTSRRGNVKYQLTDLEEGDYRAMFRVWDIFNNPTSYTFDFTVSDKTQPAITLMQAYPSPVRQGETVTFRLLHNRPESADKLRVQVYTQTGIKVLDETVRSNSCDVVYLEPNATRKTQISKAQNADETSQLMGSSTLNWTADVAPGVYLYRAYLSASGTEDATKSKMLIVY